MGRNAIAKGKENDHLDVGNQINQNFKSWINKMCLKNSNDNLINKTKPLYLRQVNRERKWKQTAVWVMECTHIPWRW